MSAAICVAASSCRYLRLYKSCLSSWVLRHAYLGRGLDRAFRFDFVGFERWRPASREALLGRLIAGDRSAAPASLSPLSVTVQTPTPTSPPASSSTTSS